MSCLTCTQEDFSMDLPQTSCAKEVVDLYELINEKISELNYNAEQWKWLAKLGAETPASKFIAENKDFILENWGAFIELGVELKNLRFLEEFLSGLRKFMSQRLRKEIAHFMTNHDRYIEVEFTKKVDGIHNSPSREQLQEIVDDYIERRNCLHITASNQLNTKLKFKHHKHGG